MNRHDYPVGVVYLVDFNEMLVDPKDTPDYWSTPGRYFIAGACLRNLLLSNESIPIHLYDENEKKVHDLKLVNDINMLNELPRNVFSVMVPDFCRVFWIIPQIYNIHYNSKWIEIEPLDMMSLENLYIKNKQYFVGVNLNERIETLTDRLE